MQVPLHDRLDNILRKCPLITGYPPIGVSVEDRFYYNRNSHILVSVKVTLQPLRDHHVHVFWVLIKRMHEKSTYILLNMLWNSHCSVVLVVSFEFHHTDTITTFLAQQIMCMALVFILVCDTLNRNSCCSFPVLQLDGIYKWCNSGHFNVTPGNFWSIYIYVFSQRYHLMVCITQNFHVFYSISIMLKLVQIWCDFGTKHHTRAG